MGRSWQFSTQTRVTGNPNSLSYPAVSVESFNREVGESANTSKERGAPCGSEMPTACITCNFNDSNPDAEAGMSASESECGHSVPDAIAAQSQSLFHCTLAVQQKR